MKRIITLIVAAAAVLLASASIHAQGPLRRLTDREDIFYYSSKVANDVNGRFTSTSPSFIIFPDGKCSKESADALIEDSGMQEILNSFAGSAYVINPLGDKYDAAADLAFYKEFLTKMRTFANMKVIGIGQGATFVNEAVARNAGNLADIVTFGGKAPKKALSGESPVPAYIAGPGAAKVAASYITRDAALPQDKDGAVAYYENASESLLKVIVNNDKNATLKDVIADSWYRLMSRNYRFSNVGHTWYNGEKFCEHGDYELLPYMMLDQLGVTRNAVIQNIGGGGDYLWYEYIPEAVTNAAPGTVPLVVLLHGNNNDPRTQAETSGFIQIAAREGFMVAEFEWQGNGYAVMGHDGIETTVYHLLGKYPQLDRSRIYVEGLSAGSFNTTALGIKKSHVFAAGGAQSGGAMGAMRFGSSMNSLMDEAVQKRGAVEFPYFSISGIADDVVAFPKEGAWKGNSIFNAWNLYQTMNGLEVTPEADFSIDPVFGIKLESRRTIQTKKNISMETGDLCKDGVPLVRIVGVVNYGHWNFQEGTEMMWEYFKLFSRDPQTGKIIYHGE